MLECIDRHQRNKLKLDNLSIPSPERHRPLRHQFSSDNMHVQPFNIPNLRIDQRKTSSAEDMARKNSTGMHFVFGACFSFLLLYLYSNVERSQISKHSKHHKQFFSMTYEYQPFFFSRNE